MKPTNDAVAIRRKFSLASVFLVSLPTISSGTRPVDGSFPPLSSLGRLSSRGEIRFQVRISVWVSAETNEQIVEAFFLRSTSNLVSARSSAAFVFPLLIRIG